MRVSVGNDRSWVSKSARLLSRVGRLLPHVPLQIRRSADITGVSRPTYIPDPHRTVADVRFSALHSLQAS